MSTKKGGEKSPTNEESLKNSSNDDEKDASGKN